MILTEGQIKAQVSAIRKKTSHEPLAFALRTDRPWSGAAHVTIDGRRHRVAYCRSDLELREMLRVARTANEPLIALCPFSDERLEDDVVARLARRRVHPPEVREVLASLFQVNAVDPRVFASQKLTQALIENAPGDGYATISSGVLDLQTAWSSLLARVVGSREVASSLARFLDGTLDGVMCRRIEGMGAELRGEFFEWAALNLDRSLRSMAHVVSMSKTSDLVPLGLLLDVIFERGVGSAAAGDARVRLENWFRGHAIDEVAARTWAAAARSVVLGLSQRAGAGAMFTAVLSRCDALLAEFKVADLAARSDFSPIGFEQRVRYFAQQIPGCLDGSASGTALKPVIAALARLREHVLAVEHQRRIERCEMAARLASWLGQGGRLRGGSTLDDLVEGYVRIGGFVDWARTVVREGDIDPALNQAFETLLARVGEVCGAFEADFAANLADWTRHGARPGSAFLPVEDALEKLIGPLGAEAPVLLLVMDGMSEAVFRELLADIVQRGKWLECRPRGLAVPSALLATIPSITEVSRRALFRGKLHPESSPTEQSAFATNDRLFSLCGGQTRPVLFLKGDLQVAGETGLAASVKQAIGNRKCRVVAMVLNAVDDHLSGSDQIASRWDLDVVRPLREVLQLAAEAGRSLILTSDHGHVLEHRTTLKTGVSVGGDRYREDGGAAVDGEITVTGDRIQRAIGQAAVTVAWSHELRYSKTKKRGYHGGANPQEMVIPLSVLRHLSGSAADGWEDVSPSPYWPDWWRLAVDEPKTAAPAEAEVKLTAGLDLFVHAAAKAKAQDWIQQLLDGEVYAAQCGQGVRGAQDRIRVATFLETLSARNGTVPREVLAEKLGLPLIRLNGLVADLARIFNVDGFDVVTVDNASGTVVLNVPLLKKQFGLTE